VTPDPRGAGARGEERSVDSAASQPVRRHVTVSGRVQGVYFRDGCAREARRRGVQGWVRNRSDGRVEAVFEGAVADVDAMVEWCRSGPRRARVVSVAVLEELPVGETSFAVG
jgi:acylphosphatase